MAELRDGKVSTFEITPEQAGLPLAKLDDLVGGDREHNAAVLRTMLEGEHGAYRDIVLMSSAAALIVAGKCNDLQEGVALAAQAIDSGRALEVLNRLVRISNEASPNE